MRSFLVLLLVAGSVSSIQGQTSRPEFEVVDIKLNKSDSLSGIGQILAGGLFRATNISVKEIIKFAYNVRDEAIVGGPGWLDSDHYDIIGKAPAAGSDLTFWRSDARVQSMQLYYGDQTFRLMTQSMLADRFNLAIHTEQRPADIYALTVAKGGSKLVKASGSGKPDCLRTVDTQLQAVLTCKNMTVSDLGRALQVFAPGYADHEVVDATGLEGTYDFTISWVGRTNVDQGGMTIPAALEKLLGLRWEARKQPMPAIVIDRIERPSDN